MVVDLLLHTARYDEGRPAVVASGTPPSFHTSVPIHTYMICRFVIAGACEGSFKHTLTHEPTLPATPRRRSHNTDGRYTCSSFDPCVIPANDVLARASRSAAPFSVLFIFLHAGSCITTAPRCLAWNWRPSVPTPINAACRAGAQCFVKGSLENLLYPTY